VLTRRPGPVWARALCVSSGEPEDGEHRPGGLAAFDITIDTDGPEGDATDTLTATADHPFWVSDPFRE